ncbi:hypothetical protein E4U22_005882 [Claviceps purpurea]|nr:hypothetical protein E4U22_005882 [Claviceps purpurea]
MDAKATNEEEAWSREHTDLVCGRSAGGEDSEEPDARCRRGTERGRLRWGERVGKTWRLQTLEEPLDPPAKSATGLRH